jgi:4,5-dihydroxyphthalate decarboxylase
MSTVLTEPLKSGAVKPDGLELSVFDPETTDSNSRDMINLKFDVAEMSIATLVKAVERGLPLVALPVFTSGRRFVQSGMYLARGSDITSLEQLRGRTVGLPQYWISSCLWQRMVLKEMYGIAPEDVRWVSSQPERFEGVGVPNGVDLRLDTDRDLAQLMRDGEVDACLMPGGRPLPPDLAKVTAPAYPDCVAAEREYYLARRVFPAMHVTVVKRSLAEREPAAVHALLAAYSRAKELASSRPDGEWPLPPLGHDRPALRELLGGDPWPYGITPNRVALEAFLQGAVDQGLLQRKLQLEEIFAGGLPQDFR